MIGWLSLGLVLFLLGLSYLCYRITFQVPREKTVDPYRLPKGEQYGERREQMTALIDRVVSLPYETVSIRSWDGLSLSAKYYETAPGAPLEILFHGYQSNALRDFCGGLSLALRSGHNALLVDQRAHGKSEGRCLSFGILERKDCLDWVHYAVNRFGEDTPILLAGVSMGAATVLMAAGEPLPEQVVGIISDCGYTSPREIIRKVLRDRGYPQLLYPFIWMGGRLFGGFSLGSGDAPSALSSSNVPVLFLHGEDDRFVPCEMSRENYSACGERSRLVTFPGAGHGLSYLVDQEKYERAVEEFVESLGKDGRLATSISGKRTE